MTATITQLTNELIELVQSVKIFKEKSYSVYNIDDLLRLTELNSYPIIGVGYEGARLNENFGNAVESRSHSAGLVDVHFTLILGIQYDYAGQDDTKSTATDLLDQVRQLVLGYKGVNTRPWKFAGERPEPEVSGDGVIFYSQFWHTLIPVVGQFNNL